MHQNKNQNKKHIPVLLDAVLSYLQPKAGESYLDLTAGYGGHATAILEHTKGRAILVDRDAAAADYLRQHFSSTSVEVRHQDFLAASEALQKAGKRFDMILADLGVSSPHLDTASRGFAIAQSGPLDMRMDQSQALSAAGIANTYKEKDLAKLISEYGEERRAKQIAHAIVLNRPVLTTSELANIVIGSSGRGTKKRAKIHPATKTFQALRIAVNDELDMLGQALPIWMQLLASGGRLAVISFHSLEDRIVKAAFADAAGGGYDSELTMLTKRPVRPEPPEIVSNPRARSAKLRAVAKINNKRKGLHANPGKK